MRASVVLIIAVLIAALLLLDNYEYDGHYRKAAVDGITHEVERILGH